MKRWEYLVVDLPYAGEAIALNDIGNNGWELVGIYPAYGVNGTAIFKRPKDDEDK